MATYYEAKVCLENENARTMVGARPTLAACAMGEVCAETLYSFGTAAASAVDDQRVDDALERVVEANTLCALPARACNASGAPPPRRARAEGGQSPPASPGEEGLTVSPS